jgi:hypothetical protein
MTWFAAPLLLALAVASTQAPLPRMTHAEGLVVADVTGVRTTGGRAEVVLGTGATIHIDAGTAVRYGDPVILDDGRIVVRAAAAPLQIETALGTLHVGPGAVCTLTVDAAAGRLLLNVAAGEATLRTRYAHTTRVLAGQSALMTSPTAVPWAAAYTPATLDHFAIWSDARVAASGHATGTADDWVASGLSSATFGTTPPCSGWPSWTAPCWVLPPAHQRPSRPWPGAPTYAPKYAPNYTPNFNVGPNATPPPPGAGSPDHQRRRHQPPPPQAAPPPPQTPPAPAQEGPRGRSGAVKRPPPE